MASSLFARTIRRIVDKYSIFCKGRAGWAEACGVSVQELDHWLNDRSFPSPDELDTIIWEYMEYEQRIGVTGGVTGFGTTIRNVLKKPLSEVTPLAPILQQKMLNIPNPTLAAYMNTGVLQSIVNQLAQRPRRNVKHMERVVKEFVESFPKEDEPRKLVSEPTGSASN